MAKGRRVVEDTTPGKILALALLANAPIALAFILIPIYLNDPVAARRYAPIVVWATPLFAVLSVMTFVRAKPERRMHRAARIGLVLAVVALALWGLVLYATLRTDA
ncbi:MAG TPA: hypothetical protein VFH78_01410 [Candidatus Thermoplasmatota archaeon]|nr:hypothetical protein [Candidatus Thermoplasmatota archaeon]